jgi:glyoxylase-like metal-dependent hydrolase (beta-lactamase superfamily II)
MATPSTFPVGEIRVHALCDGISKVPASYLKGADWTGHEAELDATGRFDLPVGCFLVETGATTVLLDAGQGTAELHIDFPADGTMSGRMDIVGGDLPDQLAAAGFRPEDIDMVAPTHLHNDHVGWLVQDDKPFFPNATVRFGAADYDHFVGREGPAGEFHNHMMSVLGDRVDLIHADGPIAPGIDALAAPGHTPGHLLYALSSGRSRALMLGDSINCPLQVENTACEALGDLDPATARATRERVMREVEGTDTLVGGPHFPGLRYGRVLAGEGRRYFV